MELTKRDKLLNLKSMKVIDFEQHGKKAIKDLQESLQAVTCFFDVHEEPTENLKSEHRPNIQQRIIALKRAQEHTHNLTDSSDRLEAVELLVKAWEQLSQHAEVQYRLARKGLQQKRYVQITPEELKLEVSLHLELGEPRVHIFLQGVQRVPEQKSDVSLNFLCPSYGSRSITSRTKGHFAAYHAMF
jgi:hypothetical protein